MGFFSFLFGDKSVQPTPVDPLMADQEEAMEGVAVKAPFAMYTAEDALNGVPMDLFNED